MTPAALHLLLQERGDRVARANGESVPDRDDPGQYGSTQEFAAIAAMPTT